MKKSQSNPLATKQLTEVEQELMSILWSLGEGTVNEVIKELPKERDLAYTSVSTILRILEQKKVLSTRKEGRGHIYIPILQKKDFESATVQQVVKKVFGGAPVALIQQLLSSSDLKAKDLEEIRELLSKHSQLNPTEKKV